VTGRNKFKNSREEKKSEVISDGAPTLLRTKCDVQWPKQSIYKNSFVI